MFRFATPSQQTVKIGCYVAKLNGTRHMETTTVTIECVTDPKSVRDCHVLLQSREAYVHCGFEDAGEMICDPTVDVAQTGELNCVPMLLQVL